MGKKLMKIAMAKEKGTAIITAMIDVTSVPAIKTAMPNLLALGCHRSDV